MSLPFHVYIENILYIEKIFIKCLDYLQNDADLVNCHEMCLKKVRTTIYVFFNV